MQITVNDGDSGGVIIGLDDNCGNGIIQLCADVVAAVAGHDFKTAICSWTTIDGIVDTILLVVFFFMQSSTYSMCCCSRL